jgi:hypothetical protein
MFTVTKRALATALVLGLFAAASRADILTTDPSLPPTSAIGGTAAYLTPAQVHAMYSGPGLTIVLSQIEHHAFSNIQRSTSGGNEFETFNSVLDGQASINGSPNIPVTLSGPVQVEVFGKAGMTTGTFSTHMLSMDMTGTVAGHEVEVTLDPANSTTGQTIIADQGGGLFRIDSFFDVFTEISLDQGPFIPQNNGPSLVQLSTVPEPASLILFGVGAAGTVIGSKLRRRRRIA